MNVKNLEKANNIFCEIESIKSLIDLLQFDDVWFRVYANDSHFEQIIRQNEFNFFIEAGIKSLENRVQELLKKVEKL